MCGILDLHFIVKYGQTEVIGYCRSEEREGNNINQVVRPE